MLPIRPTTLLNLFKGAYGDEMLKNRALKKMVQVILIPETLLDRWQNISTFVLKNSCLCKIKKERHINKKR